MLATQIVNLDANKPDKNHSHSFGYTMVVIDLTVDNINQSPYLRYTGKVTTPVGYEFMTFQGVDGYTSSAYALNGFILDGNTVIVLMVPVGNGGNKSPTIKARLRFKKINGFLPSY